MPAVDNLANRLSAAVGALAPVHGVSIGRRDDKRTWRIDFAAEATTQQKAAAQSALNAFDANAVPAADIKTEARRRILARFPDWKQTNMTARGVELQDLWRRNGSWTAGEQAEADALQAAWDWIKAVRAASDALEAMSPIPTDYADARYWPA